MYRLYAHALLVFMSHMLVLAIALLEFSARLVSAILIAQDTCLASPFITHNCRQKFYVIFPSLDVFILYFLWLFSPTVRDSGLHSGTLT